MRLNSLCQHVILLSLVVLVNSITVYPGQNSTFGNCTGPADYLLCNCLTSNTTIDIHLSPGQYNLTTQPFCLLENKTSVTITGSQFDSTIIECIEPFNIVFLRVQNIIISNIQMNRCGNELNESTNATIQRDIPATFFGDGFRFALMLHRVKNVSITNLSMSRTLGYAILAFNALGQVTLSNVQIKNTNLNNEPNCKNYSTNITADFSCSGGGMIIVYHDHVEIDNVTIEEADTNFTIEQSVFENNFNILPIRGLHSLNEAISSTGYYRVPIPIQGAGGIALYYLQTNYNVNVGITNTTFHNNHGSTGGSATIMSISSTRGITTFNNCLLSSDHKAANGSARGGISYIYLILRNAPGINNASSVSDVTFNALHVSHCNFSSLSGMLGAAFRIEKLASVPVNVVVIINKCNFIENAANAGSAVYAIDRVFGASKPAGGLTVYLINVNAERNKIASGSILDYISSEYITGVFHTRNSQFIVNCTQHCKFSSNQPSVFYGHHGFIMMSGKAQFTHNKAYFGGALFLIDTLLYIYIGTELLFDHNYATKSGGAINVLYSSTNIRSEDICPIQFIGPRNARLIFAFDDLVYLNVNITFRNNTVGTSASLQSIFANVFYYCSWYPDTLIQYNFDDTVPPVNGTRDAVYHKVFNFIPEASFNKHLHIIASLPCLCNGNNEYDSVHCMSAGFYNALKLTIPIIIGRSFQLSLVGLDSVGLVGATFRVFADVYIDNVSDGSLTLADGQNRRTFLSTPNNTCSSINFTVYGMLPRQPDNGHLSLSFLTGIRYEYDIEFSNNPVGFIYKKDSDTGLYSFVCSQFLQTNVHDDFCCDSSSGVITRNNLRSWLSQSDKSIEYTALCLPTYCNRIVTSFELSDTVNAYLLCNNNHTGRACGTCIEGYSRVFGSSTCKPCSNAWLATILLYVLLGVILVFVLFVLRLTVTVGAINGVIFFCNVMSINENLFFNEKQFSFLRVFISFINLDLGFDMCFYDGMTQIAKTGFQFVFPVYLWLIIMIIIFMGKFYFRRRNLSSYPVVPVLATLILLSYSKLLRTTISVFSFMTIHYTTNESDYSVGQSIVTWQPDSTIRYLYGWHVVLFVISLGVVLLFVLPFTFALTFPKVILRSKWLSHFYPLLDCYYAPYKNKYRFWLGMRLNVLVYLSGMESVLFSKQEVSLLSGVIVVLVFAIVQAYIRPFKNTLINILDLTFTGIFILLSVIALYLYPSVYGYEKVSKAVNVLGFVAFFFICLVVMFHIHTAVQHVKWYKNTVSILQMKLERWNCFSYNTANWEKESAMINNNNNGPYFIQFQESLFAQI